MKNIKLDKYVDMHFIQFKLNYYKADSLISSNYNLMYENIMVLDEKNGHKTYRRKFFNDEHECLVEVSRDDEDSDYKEYYYHCIKDIFFIEPLFEVGNFEYNNKSTQIVKWLQEELVNEGNDEQLDYILPQIYIDVEEYIKKYFTENDNRSHLIFERPILLHCQSHTSVYEYTEYGFTLMYGGLLDLNKLLTNKKMTKDDFNKKAYGEYYP